MIISDAENSDGDSFQITSNGEEIASISFMEFANDIPEDIPDEEYYRAVYTDYRLSSFQTMLDYTPVRSDERTEAATAKLEYAEIENYEGPLAGAPHTVTDLLLVLDKEEKVYAAIQLSEENILDSNTLQNIALSLSFYS